MTVQCPRCHRELPPDDVNVAKDTAYCRTCRETWTVGQLMTELAAPPPGCNLRFLSDGFLLSASTRSWLAFVLIPFAILWNAGIWSFGAKMLGDVFPPAEDLGTLRFLPFLMAAFLLPFILAGLHLVLMSLMALFGRIVVSVHGDEGRLFRGIGSIGWTRRFAWSRVADVATFTQRGEDTQWQVGALVLNSGKRLKLGMLLGPERLAFVIGALRQLLASRAEIRP